MWFTLAVSGYICLAVVTILDKYILSEQKVPPLVFVFYSTVFILPIGLLVPFGVKFFVTPTHWLGAATAALFFVLALFATYRAMAESEASHINPFIGAIIPGFILVLSGLFLGENITVRQELAIAFLMLGSLIISFENSVHHHGWHRGFLWGILAGLCAAVYQVMSKYIYGLVGFYSGFVWIWAMIGAIGTLLVLFPIVRQHISVKKPKKKNKRSAKFAILFAVDKTLGGVGMVLVQYAVSLGSVAVVNALAGVQYGFLVILIAALSKFSPRIFQEKYSAGEIWQEIIAVLFIAVGLVLVIV